MTDIREYLANYKTDWANASEDGSFPLMPEGEYPVRVDTVMFATDEHGDPALNKNGDAMLKWELVVIDGEYSGEKLFHRHNINENGIRFMKADIAKCGVSLEDIEELPDRLGDILDAELVVLVEHSEYKGKTYANVKFLGAR